MPQLGCRPPPPPPWFQAVAPAEPPGTAFITLPLLERGTRWLPARRPGFDSQPMQHSLFGEIVPFLFCLMLIVASFCLGYQARGLTGLTNNININFIMELHRSLHSFLCGRPCGSACWSPLFPPPCLTELRAKRTTFIGGSEVPSHCASRPRWLLRQHDTQPVSSSGWAQGDCCG